MIAQRLIGGCIALVSMLLCACEAKQVADGEQFDKWQQSREIKRISESQMQAKAFQLGDSVVDAVRKEWKEALSAADSGKGGSAFCGVRKKELAKGRVRVLAKTDLTRKVFKEKERNNLTQQIRSAYQHSAEQGQEAGANIQQGSGFFLYTEPVYLEKSCLRCHYHQKAQFSKSEPLTNLVGLWVVDLSKKELALHW